MGSLNFYCLALLETRAHRAHLTEVISRGDSSSVSCPKLNSQEVSKVGVGIPGHLSASAEKSTVQGALGP